MNKNYLSYTQIRKRMDKLIIGLDYQKDQLISMYLKHYNEDRNYKVGDRRTVSLLVGQSGSGKTAIVEALAHATDREFYSISAASISPEGYKGLNLSKALGSFYSSLKGRKDKFETSIIFIDEFDKVVTNVYESTGSSITDQQTYLKLLDSGNFTIMVDKTPISIDTTNMFIVLAGAFTSMRKSNNSINHFGFVQEKLVEKNRQEKGIELIESLKKFGFMDEIIGRIGLMIEFPSVDKNLIINILKADKNVITKWKQYFINTYQVKFKLTDKAQDYIADLVIKSNLGVRGINQVILPLMNEANINIQKNTSINRIILKYDNTKGLVLSYKYGVRKIEFDKEHSNFKVACPRDKKGLERIHSKYIESRDLVEQYTFEYVNKLLLSNVLTKYEDYKKIECLFRSILLFMSTEVKSDELNEDSLFKLLNVALMTNYSEIATVYRKLITSDSRKYGEYYDEILDNYEEYQKISYRTCSEYVKELIMLTILEHENMEDKINDCK